MAFAIDSDRAITRETEDQFGFLEIADQLAPAIRNSSKGDGLVIGLEGQWGSGKTSLMNFLRKRLEENGGSNIHTITLAPWLNGDTSTLVLSMLDPIAKILDKYEENNVKDAGSKFRIFGGRTKQKAGDIVRAYGKSTARRLAPLASLAGYVVPGGQIAADVLNTTADLLEEFSPDSATLSQMKSDVEKRIRATPLSFIVLIDDLDRLEPAQAVEVVRLVRSVADFPRVTYLMCYDRAVLAGALETGLKVQDGDKFLQKIVQLTFSIPLPEPFDLRMQFRNEALEHYRTVTGSEPDKDLLDELNSAIDYEGMDLATPRQVKLALNSIRFVFPALSSLVYFPDLCRLHLIKTCNRPLYDWLESYLSVRSVVVAGDALLNKEGKAKMGKDLKRILPSDDPSSSKSIYHLGSFIPGLTRHKEAEKCVFGSVSERDVQRSIDRRRLGSPYHYRYYFALTGPKTALPDEKFKEMLDLARNGDSRLEAVLSEYALVKRQSGKLWFEHVLTRFDELTDQKADAREISGIIVAVSNMMDVALANDVERGGFSISIDRLADHVVGRLFKKLAELDSASFSETAQRISREGKAINWLVGRFFRSEVWDHGRVGERRLPEQDWTFSESFLDVLLGIVKERIASYVAQEDLMQLPKLSAFLFGWRDICGEDGPRKWIQQATIEDIGFLKVLNSLRSWAMSDHVYYPLHRSSVEAFLDLNNVTQRLEALASGEHRVMAEALQEALRQGSDQY